MLTGTITSVYSTHTAGLASWAVVRAMHGCEANLWRERAKHLVLGAPQKIGLDRLVQRAHRLIRQVRVLLLQRLQVGEPVAVDKMHQVEQLAYVVLQRSACHHILSTRSIRPLSDGQLRYQLGGCGGRRAARSA